MQTTIELSEERLHQLDQLTQSERISVEELVGKALDAYVSLQPVPAGSHSWAEMDAAFGLWKDRGEDGLAYQLRMRAEWDREWDR